MEPVSNEEILRKMVAKMALVLRIGKRKLKFMEHIFRKGGFGEIKTPNTYWVQQGQKEKSSKLSNELVEIDSRTRICRDVKVIKIV